MSKINRRNFIKSVAVIGSVVTTGIKFGSVVKKEEEPSLYNPPKGVFSLTSYSNSPENDTFVYNSMVPSYSDEPFYDIDGSNIRTISYLNNTTEFQRLKIFEKDKILFDIFAPPSKEIRVLSWLGNGWNPEGNIHNKKGHYYV